MGQNNTPEVWNAIWGRKRTPFFSRFKASLNREVRKHLEGLQGRMLEAGCGEASLLPGLNASYVGMDFSRAACRISRSKAPVVLGDIHRMPFKEAAFDIVFNQSVIQAEKDPALAIGMMAGVLKKGGKAVFTVPKKFSLFHLMSVLGRVIPVWPGVRQRYWNEKEVRKLLGARHVSIRKIWHGQLLLVEMEKT